MQKLFFTLVLFITFQTAHAQNLTGQLQNSNKQAIAKAAITLWNTADSSIVSITQVDENGKFIVENIKNGNYWILTSAMGYAADTIKNITMNNTNLALPTIVLQKGTKKITGVTVLSKKPYIEVKADKTVINVESSINATGSNALEILAKSPGVIVDKDDNISLKGKSGVMVYIDGKQTYLDNASVAAMLKNTQSTNIEAIEIIANPGAKYDAEGNAGVINIRLKKNKKLGTNGSIGLGANYGYTPKGNTNFTLNNNNRKTNVFLMYGNNFGKREGFIQFKRILGGQEYNQKSVTIDNDFDNTYKAAIDYNLNTKNTIGVMVNGGYSKENFTNTSNTFIGNTGQSATSTLYATNDIIGVRNNLNGNVNYKFADTNGTTLNIDLDAGRFRRPSNSYQPNEYRDLNLNIINQLIYRTSAPIEIDILTAKADYECKAFKGKLGFGVKTSYVVTENTFDFYNVVNNIETKDLDKSNTFKYTENVNAAYANYNREFNTKWSTQLGLRAEQTNSNGQLTSIQASNNDTVARNYINLFPSAGLTYNVNAKHTLGLTYSRRIERPSYQDLNPFEFKLDELTYQKGNAFLRPQYANSVELTHTFMQFLTTGLSYSRITDVYAQITDTADGNRAFITQKNLANSDVFGLNISAPMPIKKWWFAFANLGLNYTHNRANFNGNIIDIQFPSMSFYAENNFTLPKGYTASVSGFYAMPGYWGGTFKTSPIGNLDLGIQKSFFNKKLNAKLSFTDLFWSQRWHGVSDFAGLYLDARGGNETRQVRLNLTYRFGSNTVGKTRDRKTGLEEESSRIKN
jgi:iron complex outermembrane recepter protein